MDDLGSSAEEEEDEEESGMEEGEGEEDFEDAVRKTSNNLGQ